MYNLAIRKCTSPPPPSPEVENFQIKIYYPAGDRTPDLLNQRQTCYLLSQRGEHCWLVVELKEIILSRTGTWNRASSFTCFREEDRSRVFENKVLRKIFGAKRDKITREWRKLHNSELHALYSSPSIISNLKSKRLRWAGHVTLWSNPEMNTEFSGKT